MAVFRPGHPKYGGNLGLWPGEFIQYLHEEGSRGQPVLTDVKNLKAACDSTGAKGSGVGSLGPLGGMVRRYSFRTCTLGSLLCL